MTTPIADFVRAYAAENNLRLHMPGHKGKGFLGFERYDITEIDGADVLYRAEGIIKESQENAARLFGTRKTVYSAEGSSLAIRAMLYLIKLYGGSVGKRPLIAAGRNAHKTFMTACALLDFEVEWLMPENAETLISCDITADFLESYLKGALEKPIAVYVTSPDYLGNVLDIRALSEVCRRHGVLLLADNAHGAYLKFLPESRHPISLGADMCCDSAHKTLPVLTGGAYLHISSDAPRLFSDQAEAAMALFASTSPSYLILQSLDMANSYLSGDHPRRLAEFAKEVTRLKGDLEKMGYRLFGNEPLKIAVAPKSYGYTGVELAQILLNKGIVCEFSDPDFTVMMLAPETGTAGLKRVRQALSAVEKRQEISVKPPMISGKEKRLSLKNALFSPSVELDINECGGRVLASANVSCPPAIPIVVCGEVIDQNAIECFTYYGIKSCRVVD